MRFERIKSTLVKLLFLACLPWILSGCNKTSNSVAFSASQSSNGDEGGRGSGSHVYEISKTFDTTDTVPLDIVWVIDNSGSMNEEAAHVRNNFAGFISTVGSQADLKVALISEDGTSGTDVHMPNAGSSFMQIDRKVNSTDAFQITSSALCGNSGGIACSASQVTTYNGVHSQLRGFLRANSKKVFVFVTDDDSYMLAEDFLDVMTESYGQEPTVFGFVALSAAESPCMARPGVEYKVLAQRTGGEVYNICDADWTGTFHTLASNIVRLSIAPVALPAAVRQGTVTSVEINGVTIPSSHYSIDSAGLHIDRSEIPASGVTKIKVHYTS